MKIRVIRDSMIIIDSRKNSWGFRKAGRRRGVAAVTAEACRTYRLKVYLDAACRMPGEERADPVSAEFSLLIQIPGGGQVPSSTLEDAARQTLAPFQRALLNGHPLFQDCIPSLENVTDRLAGDFARRIREAGGTLLEIESSITPTRSYLLCLERGPQGGPRREREGR